MKKVLFLRICQLFCILLFLLLLTHSALVLYYAKEGISAWAFSVLPVLLPFIILSKFWIYYDVPQLFYQTSKKILPGRSSLALSATILFLGLSSGFPVGAIFVHYFYTQGILSKKSAETLLPLCSFVSPMFLIGYVQPLTGYKGIYWIIFALCLYLPLILCFGKDVFLENIHPQKQSAKVRLSLKHNTAENHEKSSVRDIWLSSMEIIFTIGIYMMLFSILFGLTLHEPILRNTITEILLSNLEVTTGIRWVSQMPPLKGIIRGVVMAVVVSLGGLCTTAQVYSIIIDSNLSMKKYLYTKGKCALLSAVLFILLTNLTR